MIKDTMSLTKAQFSALLTRVNYLTPRDETPMEEQEKTTTVSAAIDLNRKRSELSAQYDAVVTSTSALDAAVQESVEEKMQHPYEFVDPSAMDVDEDEGPSRVDYINEQIALRKKELDPQEVDNLRKIFARFDRGDRDSIVIDKFSIDMSVRKMNCLKPGCWLNDEIINFYMNMLQARNNAKVNAHNEVNADAIKAGSTTELLTSHFFSSFFYSKLTEQGNYNYKLVKRWTKKFNIFQKEKIVIPLNINDTHWTLLIVCMQRKEIHYYDSMSGSGRWYLSNVMKWIVDEGREKHSMVVDENEWKLLDRYPKDVVESICASSGNTEYYRAVYADKGNMGYVPQQENGYDCGMFSCIAADFFMDDIPLLRAYTQRDMTYFRLKVGTDILRGEVNY